MTKTVDILLQIIEQNFRNVQCFGISKERTDQLWEQYLFSIAKRVGERETNGSTN